MIKETNEINFNNLKKNANYLSKRGNMIKLIKYFVDKLKFRSQTFYLATYMTDLIMMRTLMN